MLLAAGQTSAGKPIAHRVRHGDRVPRQALLRLQNLERPSRRVLQLGHAFFALRPDLMIFDWLIVKGINNEGTYYD